MSKRAARTLRQFLDEAHELLGAFEGALGRLDDDAADPAAIDECFRVMHTLKGIAEPFRRVRVGEIAHMLETVLDHIRLGRTPLTAALRETMVEAIEVSRAELAAVDGGPRLELDDFVRFLERLQGAAEGGGEQGRPGPAVIAGIPLDGLTQYQEHRLRDNLGRGAGLYRLRASFLLEHTHDGLERLSAAAGALGELIASLPVSGADDRLVFDVLLTSTRSRAEVAATVGAAVEAVTELTPARASAAGAERTRDEGSAAGAVRLEAEVLDRLAAAVAGARAARHRLPAADALAELDRQLAALEGTLESLRSVPLDPTFDKLRRIARSITRGQGIEARLTVAGGAVRIDRRISDQVADALLHLVRNALDHGVESREEREAAGKPPAGAVHLEARREGAEVVIAVRDDGRGIDPEQVARAAVRRGLRSAEEVAALGAEARVELVLLPGMTTREQVSELSGRGVGMDVVKTNVEQVGGRLLLRSQAGRGTEVVLFIPAGPAGPAEPRRGDAASARSKP